MSTYQACRACGTRFPYDAEADYCPRCAATNAGDTVVTVAARTYRVDDERGFTVARFTEDAYGKVNWAVRYDRAPAGITGEVQ